eukprot:CAMPEP_0168244698 /NCGR_PEP_ID=MMETSP0140_2-20121125/24768_1 /TAXON_ID=44445 /ORGANISM="Pseudo-nitzschia australis, Strain 10249 10 AB" /LENGTH=30 /DNA_ID= /DNA_START= /DNA_END= /DNA_ORIENTATION=
MVAPPPGRPPGTSTNNTASKAIYQQFDDYV